MNTVDNRTLKELAQEALDVQNACNGSGVAHSLVDVYTRLRQLPGSQGTNWLNGHPIVVNFLDKLNSLAGIQPKIDADAWIRICEAESICRELASGRITEVPESWRY